LFVLCCCGVPLTQSAQRSSPTRDRFSPLHPVGGVAGHSPQRG
jgi:hypothetical protein